MINSIDINHVIEIAKKAGAAIMEIYEQPFSVEEKEDRSPLTAADKAANEIILEGLLALYPDIPYISEETKQTDFAIRKDWDYFWMIDPLDGTKEFIKKNGEFTVNIALVNQGRSVLGVVYVPVQDSVYYAIEGQGAFKVEGRERAKQIFSTAIQEEETVKIFASRSHLNEDTQNFVDTCKEKYADVEIVSAGSSLKFCLLAEGKAHIYPRFAPTMEWDTAAAHIIATEAGASITIPESGKPLNYNKENLLNPWFLVMA